MLTRLAKEYSGNRLIEIDYPVVADLKNKISDYPNLEFAGFDLSKVPVDAALATTDFNKELPVIYLMEGVAMYLPENIVFDLINKLSSLSDNKTALIFSAMNSLSVSSIFSLLTLILKKNNSKLCWSKSPEELKAAAAKQGLLIIDQKTHESFFEGFDCVLPKPIRYFGEYYNYAEVMP